MDVRLLLGTLPISNNLVWVFCNSNRNSVLMDNNSLKKIEERMKKN